MTHPTRHTCSPGIAGFFRCIFGSATVFLVLLVPALADGGIADKFVNDPSRGWATFGATATHELIQDPAVKGGTAQRVTISAKGAQPWDAGALTNVVKPIAKGDVLLLAFYARAQEPPEGAQTIDIIARLQEADAPYTSIGTQETVHLGTGWKLYYAKGVALKDYKVGGVSGALNLATGKQVIDFGPIMILDFGAGYDMSQLPANR